jgi:dipeptidyl aminopeptidase/acylaminoacyl peptidase
VGRGILYKPENFDPTKKYPVLINFYEIISDGLNAYIEPEPVSSGCVINVPTYVSNGYLVFKPDIYQKVGSPGKAAADAVLSGAKHLQTLPYVNGEKMGIQGCSFGGFETNYLVTRSSMFAAACTAAGASNFVGNYGDIHGQNREQPRGATSQQGIFETGQYRIGKNIWEGLDLYIEHSAVLRADKITTPMLIMHTNIDGAVPFAQAVDFFTALRRLGKTAWMLEYEDGNHGVHGLSADDFGIRMGQFFDYYLKDALPPKWMTQGVPAAMKGIDSGLQLDTSGRKPGPGLCCIKKIK